ncbi:hypothetical protein LCGC14_1492260 [marine sediment metagenome]|uniref:Uncharacterized protein n=1 Tax=marine sediment metagenome TaxID=412755 RepID=A0A0F9M854_9ZZZZ
MAKRRSIFLGQGGDLHPAVGVGITVGVGTGAAIAVRQFSGHDKWSEAIGGGIGLLAGFGLMVSERTRTAGWVGIVGVLMNNGLRFAESMLSSKQKMKDLQGKLSTHTATMAEGAVSYSDQYAAMQTAAGNLGIVTTERIQALGAIMAAKMPVLGAVTASPMPTLGDVQIEPRQLAGALPTFQGGAGGVNIVGGLGAQIGAQYGATCMG